MNGFEKMRLRNNTSGGSMRQEKINQSKYILYQDNENDPSYCDSMFIWLAADINDKSEQIHPRIYNRKKSSTYGVTQQFQTPYDEKINIGDLFYNTDDNSYWLCVESFDLDEILWNGLLAKCNFIIKFQSKDGAILSYPCITTTSAGRDKETNTLTLPDGRKKVIILSDENTILLANDMRMYLDLHPTKPRPYKITFVDTTVGNYGDKGIIEVYMQEDLAENNSQYPDRPDLGICNYFEPNTSLPPVGNESYTELSVNGSLMLGGRPCVITSIFYDSKDVTNENIVAVWDVQITEGYEEYFTIVKNKNTCSIQISDENIDILDYSPIIINVSDEMVIIKEVLMLS